MKGQVTHVWAMALPIQLTEQQYRERIQRAAAMAHSGDAMGALQARPFLKMYKGLFHALLTSRADLQLLSIWGILHMQELHGLLIQTGRTEQAKQIVDK